MAIASLRTSGGYFFFFPESEKIPSLRVFGDEYFDYYRDYHAFWKLCGMELPDGVLRKLYYANAVKVVKGLPRQGLPVS